MPKPVHEIVRDLDFAYRQNKLTPSFIDTYAEKFGERVPALYALATKNFLEIAHEEGRNDHVLTEWESTVNVDAVMQAMEEESQESMRRLRDAREDGRPAYLRKSSSAYAPFRAVKPKIAFTIDPEAVEAAAAATHLCGETCAH